MNIEKVVVTASDKFRQMEDLIVERAQMQQRHAKEIGALDNAIMTCRNEVSALLSVAKASLNE